MLKKLPYLFSCFVATLCFNAAKAQEYQQMPISSGLNADVIANGVGTALSSTSIDIDGVNYNYVAQDFKLTDAAAPLTYGVPANGLINSIVGSTPGLSYQLAPLTGNNSLRLATGGSTSGTIAFATPIATVNLYMLGVTGSGTGTVTALVNFTDGTSQSFTGVTVADWFGGTNAAIQGIGRITRTNSTLEPNATNPRMYQITLAITAANQAKPIESVQITKTSTGNEVVNIFAFSADAYTSCPAPTNITSVSTIDGATLNWTAPATAPSAGYEYYVTTSATPPASTVSPTGSVAAGVTTVTLTNLIAGLNYNFWVRSNCGPSDKGFWKLKTFVVGEIAVTYTAGDGSTKFFNNSENEVTITTPTECPSPLSVVVPAGYKIKSIGTSYNMTAAGGAWQSEQRSLLACLTNSTTESTVTFGPPINGAGTFAYNRKNINMAVGLTGTVNFELRAWRVWGGEDCASDQNKINNNWNITATLEQLACTTPATPTGSTQNMCSTATIADLQANGIIGAQYNWYTLPSGGTVLDPSTQVTAGTYYVSQTVGTCESARSTGIVVTLNPTPLPTAVPQSFCGGATVGNLQVTSGVNIKWYSTLTGGTPLTGGVLLATGDYFVSQTVNGCESARTTVAVTINTTPPPTAEAQIFCAGSGATVANLVATPVTGGTLNWYASAIATTTLAPTTPIGTGTYFVSQTANGCESTRVSVQVTSATVIAPTSGALEVCAGATVADLVAQGSPVATYKWYESQASTTPLAADTPVVTGTYFVTQTLGPCESPKSQIAVTLNNITTPEVEDQEFCVGATVAELQATAATGATVRWYATEDGTTPLTPATALTSNTYYVSQKLNACESDRLPVVVTVNGVVATPDIEPLVVCEGSTVGDLSIDLVEGATALWYATNTAVEPLAADTPVVAGTYYVSQTLGICESARSAVEVSFYVITAPSNAGLLICSGTPLSEIEVNGADGAIFNWYATIDSTTEIDGSTVATAGTLYVSQTVNGCEGARVAVAISITSTSSPSPTATQTFCGEATVADLHSGATTTGYTVKWYSPEGDLLAEGDAVATGTYTVTQTNVCESAPVSVSVVVTAIPNTPDGPDTQEFETGETLADLDIEFADGTTVEWFYLDEDVWVSLPAATPLVDGNVYGVSQSIGECQSDIYSFTADFVLGTEKFVMKNVNIHPNPASDIVNIDGQETIAEIVIINLLGQQVFSQKANAESAKINIAALPQATYILKVQGVNGATASFKIVKK